MQALWFISIKEESVHSDYRLKHTNSKTTALPCFFEDCVATFRNLSSLSSHLSCCHRQTDRVLHKVSDENSFKCSICQHQSEGITALLSHLRQHLSYYTPIICPFKSCHFESAFTQKTFCSK